MSRRLLQRQTSSSTDIQQPRQPTAELGNRAIHELWLRSDNKKKTSETTKIQEKDLPAVVESVATLPTFPTFPTTTSTTTTVQPSADILNLSPNISSPGSIRGQDDEQDSK